MVCVLLKLMTEALWLLVHLKFSLNFIIQLSLWPWINKLQVSYHEFILHLRQIEPGMPPFFPLQYPKNIQLKSKFKALSTMQNFGYWLENRLWGQSTELLPWKAASHTHSGAIFVDAQINGSNIYHSIGWENISFHWQWQMKSTWQRFSFSGWKHVISWGLRAASSKHCSYPFFFRVTWFYFRFSILHEVQEQMR